MPKCKPVTIGSKTFKSQQEAKEFYLQLKQTIFGVQVDSEHPLYETLLELVQHHPLSEDILQRPIAYFTSEQNKDWKDNGNNNIAYAIYYDGGTLTYFKLDKAITGKDTTRANFLKEAMRYALHDQKEDYRLHNDCSICAICKQPITGDLHLDHIVQFKAIASNFICDNLDETPTEFDSSNSTTAFLSTDKSYEDKWKAYHRKYAVFQPTHEQCNQSKEKDFLKRNLQLENHFSTFPSITPESSGMFLVNLGQIISKPQQDEFYRKVKETKERIVNDINKLKNQPQDKHYLIYNEVDVRYAMQGLEEGLRKRGFTVTYKMGTIVIEWSNR